MTRTIFRTGLLISCAAAAFPAAAENSADASAATASASAEAIDYGDRNIEVRGEVLYSDQINAVKTPTPILDVPQSVTITTQTDILERGFTSIGQIIDYTPGVNTSQGEGHRDAVVFRGVRSTADFFIDGMRDDVQYYRGLYNLEQVEILRGPNALLFGRGGTGGIINRVTKKGVIGETFTGGQVAIDTFGEWSVQGDVNLATGDTSALRINASYENLANHRDFYDGEQIGVHSAFRAELGASTLLDLSYEFADHDRFIDRGIPTGIDGRPVEAFADITFGDPEANQSTLEAHLLRASLQHEFADNVKGVFSAFYGDYDKGYANQYVSGYDAANTPGLVTLDGYVDTTQRQNLILSANLIGDFATGPVNHTLLVGGEYIATSSDQNRFNSFWSTTQDDNEIFRVQRPLALRGNVGTNWLGQQTTNDFTADLADFTQVELDVFSLYLQDEIELSDWLHLIVGGRFDSFDIEVLNVPANDLRTRRDEKFSPRGGIIVKPRENISIYASYSESFLPRSGEQYANINGSAAALDPDTFTNLEAGVKWNFAQGLSFTSAIFDIEQSSPQPNDNDPSTLDVIDSNIRGFEMQLQGVVTPGWHISAGYSYLDGEQVDRRGPNGLRPRELPENMFSLWNHVDVTDRVGLGLGLVHQDESFIDNGNNAVLPAYTRIDFAAFYDVSDNVRLQVNVENLTDTLYFPNAHATHQATVGAPINARFAVTGRF